MNFFENYENIGSFDLKCRASSDYDDFCLFDFTDRSGWLCAHLDPKEVFVSRIHFILLSESECIWVSLICYYDIVVRLR